MSFGYAHWPWKNCQENCFSDDGRRITCYSQELKLLHRFVPRKQLTLDICWLNFRVILTSHFKLFVNCWSSLYIFRMGGGFKFANMTYVPEKFCPYIFLATIHQTAFGRPNTFLKTQTCFLCISHYLKKWFKKWLTVVTCLKRTLCSKPTLFYFPQNTHPIFCSHNAGGGGWTFYLQDEAAPSNTRRWPNTRLMLAHRLRRWVNISPVLGYHVVFGATLNVGQHHRRRANINPALVQSMVSRYMLYKPTIDPAMCRCNVH